MRSALINVMVRAVEKAGKALVRDFGEVEQLQVSQKGPKDFVTNADHKSESILREELSRARPDFAFLMEESGASGATEAKERWIVDPLDGTKNFMHGLPLWAINVAAERDGEVVAAVTYVPIGDQLFWAEKGVGAYVNNQRLRVSARANLADTMINQAMGLSRLAKEDKLFDLFIRMTQATAGVRCLGSGAIGLAYVAAGRLDGLVGNGLSPWDTAAGSLMIREAGGKVSTEGDLTVASNYHIHQPLLDIVRGK
jgi:myo-inositol-1(or 4)-monophosphatase